MLEGFNKGIKDLTAPLMSADEKPPPVNRRLSTGTKVERALEAAAGMADEKNANPAVGACLRASSPILAVIARIAVAIAPIFIYIYTKAYEAYKVAPTYAIRMVFGVALCFFGGTFTASIAAIEAVRQMGWQTMYANIKVLVEEGLRVQAANEIDEAKDDDGDGVVDVDQISPAALAQRKVILVMRSVKEPPRLQAAAAALWGAYLAVLATLRLQFAQTTAIALGIVETIQPPLIRLCVPPLALVLNPLELGHWTETLVDTTLKVVAIIFAWYLQMIISAYYSALRGGRIFALALCEKVEAAGWNEYVEKLPGVQAPFNPETSYLDEAVGYTVAVAGVLWQLSTGFAPPFPINIVLLPLSIVEWLLRWQITWPSSSIGDVGR